MGHSQGPPRAGHGREAVANGRGAGVGRLRSCDESGAQGCHGRASPEEGHLALHSQAENLPGGGRLHLLLSILLSELGRANSNPPATPPLACHSDRLRLHGRVHLLPLRVSCRELALPQTGCQPRQSLRVAYQRLIHCPLPWQLESNHLSTYQ